MPSNAELERWWIDAWNDLYDIVGRRTDGRCKLPDGSVVDVEGCKAWLQEQAYAGWRVGVRAGGEGEGVQVVASQWWPADERGG